MKKHAISFESGLTELDHAAWLQKILEIGAALGTSEALGDHLAAAFLEAGPNLIVTFENGDILRRQNRYAEPTGFAYTRRDGWSSLAIVSSRMSWFREAELIEYFDRLADEGFFDTFDNVLFYGEQTGGYAACTYSVTAPGSTVLALSPISTLTPSIAGFDPRSRRAKQVDFTSRYGFAPSMVEAAKDAYVVFCPQHRQESIHAAIFTRDNVTKLPAFGSAVGMSELLEELDVLEDIIRAAMAGSLTRSVFGDQYRARREHAPYLQALMRRAIEAGHQKLAVGACAVALREVDDPELRQIYEDLQTQLSNDELAQANSA